MEHEDPAVRIWNETLHEFGVCGLGSTCSLDHELRRGSMRSRGGNHIAWGTAVLSLLLMVALVTVLVYPDLRIR